MTYDLVVVGGGVTGAGVARDAALRGLKVALAERGKPGQGTTAASTHLIHGGVRYLLYDRLTTHSSCWDAGHIVRTAGDLLTRLPILWPVYKGHTRGLETVETLFAQYDLFQPMKYGKPHLRLTAEAALKVVPGLSPEGLLGALVFDEWWVDAEALARRTLESARAAGVEVLLDSPVTAVLKDGARVAGVTAGGRELRGRITVNAAGPWIDKVTSLAGARMPLRLMKGTHLIYKDKALTPVGLLLEAEDRSRYVFVVPSPLGTWVGPTDLPGPSDPDQTRTTDDEVGYLSRSVKRYFRSWPINHDATIVGSRPILGQPGAEKLLSRDFEVFDHETRDGLPGFLTIGGGKMSDYRVMAEAAVDLACRKLGVSAECRTHLSTLDGRPVTDIPDFPTPTRRSSAFCGPSRCCASCTRCPTSARGWRSTCCAAPAASRPSATRPSSRAATVSRRRAPGTRARRAARA
ncbi:MAG: FAD-dependent oxidoreductase [Elusimicrobiota bacterium]|nr:MAG: FAD-dependent oxidoreductase [Elusimicrobiota bacterium]